MKDEELEKRRAEYVYNILREFAQEVEQSSKTDVFTPERAKSDKMQLKWVCENGQRLRKLVNEDASADGSPVSDNNNNSNTNNNSNNLSDDATSAKVASTTITSSSQPTELTITTLTALHKQR